jgi:hypothetical protein
MVPLSLADLTPNHLHILVVPTLELMRDISQKAKSRWNPLPGHEQPSFKVLCSSDVSDRCLALQTYLLSKDTKKRVILPPCDSQSQIVHRDDQSPDCPCRTPLQILSSMRHGGWEYQQYSYL